MAYAPGYIAQVELLLKVLPLLNPYECFALKGGTAINLFIRDMPRLSVDIDLTYLPIEPRPEFLNNIQLALNALSNDIKQQSQGRHQVQGVYNSEQQLSKLIVYNELARIIIEPNFVLRGSVFECETFSLCPLAQDAFLSYCKIKALSFADLYGGKLCAALARQHPRDLFDTKMLLENEGISDQTRQAFIIYLVSNSRPIHELLNPEPNIQNMRKVFESSFVGMTKHNITYEELIQVRYELINNILKSFTPSEREFIISVKKAKPDWSLLPIEGIDKLPSIQWKCMNIKQMDQKRHKTALDNLISVLS